MSSAALLSGAGLVTAQDAVPLAPPDKQPENLEVEGAAGKKAGWAIVGLGELALEEIMPAFAGCKRSKPVALVSGHRDKALKVAKAHGISEDAIYDYQNFDRIADDKRIDIVYIVLPNSMHAEFTIRALKAGKHVLCEKPMAVSVEEGEAMAKAAEEAGKKLGVAYRLHYEPMNKMVMEWCRAKRFGGIRAFTSSNCQDVKAPNIRLSGKLGGGPVGDVGVYSINAARYVFNEEPVEVTAYASRPEDDPRFREVPESVSFILRYASGAVASCLCSFGTAESRSYHVHCEKGTIVMDPAFSYRGLRLRTISKSGEESPTESTEVMVPQVDHFTAEMDGFSTAVLDNGEVVTPAAMGLADMKIVEAIAKSIESGAPAKVAR
ncbi:Gfo/Idh/MocA family oxidoreductase [Luteolibacter flavescens]|uniref:Gfo/Idh/MocA family oxidoreductase n=1 Tax=Luteolibacter flavescens TaxID=1859460 RepID=A0ABT3FS64_9BACT|nr:Gfo/Idh/MocA family oxidoreductase [Luteolibacter flavescens]MCW1886039.1 Gfo/Idh/MocA family oxidoreductase [Luteolibacter flavescens]